MKGGRIIFAILLITGLWGCSSSVDKKQLEAEVHELFDLSLRLIKEKNVPGLVERFIADGELKRAGTPILNGHEEIRKSYAAMMELKDLHVTADNLQIHISSCGEMAVVLSDYTDTYETPEGMVEDSGKRQLYLVRGKDKWKIATEILSSNK